MHPKLTTLHDLGELDRLIASSTQRPVLLFKHSKSCGISAEALDELVNHLDAGHHDIAYALITVQTDRALSNAVSSTLGLRHETPQAILVRDRRVAWSASHFRVNETEIDKALDRLLE